MIDKQPNALRIADILQKHYEFLDTDDAAQELLRLHGVNFELLETLRNISECSTDAGAIACARVAIAYATGE